MKKTVAGTSVQQERECRGCKHSLANYGEYHFGVALLKGFSDYTVTRFRRYEKIK